MRSQTEFGSEAFQTCDKWPALARLRTMPAPIAPNPIIATCMCFLLLMRRVVACMKFVEYGVIGAPNDLYYAKFHKGLIFFVLLVHKLCLGIHALTAQL